jgi:hypothetical protein
MNKYEEIFSINDLIFEYMMILKSNVINNASTFQTNINQNSTADEIYRFFTDNIENDNNLLYNLSKGIIINRLINIEGVINIISFKNIINKDGNILGTIVLLLPINKIIRINDFNIDNSTSINILNSKDNSLIYTNNRNPIKYKTNKQHNEIIYTEHNPQNENEIIASEHYEDLDIMITASSVISDDNMKITNKYNYITIICVNTGVLIIITMIFLIRIRKNDACLNSIRYILENLIKGYNINALNGIKSLVANTSKIIWKDYKKFKKQMTKYENTIYKLISNTERTQNKAKEINKVLPKVIDMIDNSLNCCLCHNEDNHSNDSLNINLNYDYNEILSNIMNLKLILLENKNKNKNLNELATISNQLLEKIHYITINLGVVSGQIEETRIHEIFIELNKVHHKYQSFCFAINKLLEFNTNHQYLLEQVANIEKCINHQQSLCITKSEIINELKNKLIETKMSIKLIGK